MPPGAGGTKILLHSQHLHSFLLGCSSQLCGGDQLLSGSYPQYRTIIAVAAVCEVEGGEGTPRQSEVKKRTVL